MQRQSLLKSGGSLDTWADWPDEWKTSIRKRTLSSLNRHIRCLVYTKRIPPAALSRQAIISYSELPSISSIRGRFRSSQPGQIKSKNAS